MTMLLLLIYSYRHLLLLIFAGCAKCYGIDQKFVLNNSLYDYKGQCNFRGQGTQIYKVCPKICKRNTACLYRVSQEESSIFWEVTVSVILSKRVYMYMCPIPNGFRDIAMSLYSSKIVDNKETLGTVSNTSIYCSSNKVGTVYLV
jgi:hypothetical protein